ncbi:CLUMA_CG007369, isoform A [Clunio marinus]|uniref:CLUMA_CG007369, isoform A n=1 Tax=Clunio marinus TaxID=568069 RepID=A0A1J1I250_9DIPT|nr:CLUMA_CG007369, isoform A [Clunio marinus]
MELSDEFKIKAFKELREDGTRKKQALEQFREWISKQGHITKCRIDDDFLLRFLRVKKYSNDQAFKMLEKYLVSCESYPQWFRSLNLDDERIKEIYQSGYIFPLKDRDENGCRVILIRACKLDTKKFTFADILKSINFVIFTLLEEAETQIAGFVFIVDHKNITMDYVTLFSIIDLKNYLKCIQSAIPCRQKLGLFVNLPSFAVTLTEIGKAFISVKLRERAFFYKDSKHLKDHVNLKILPEEYGGCISTEDMIEDFKTIVERNKTKLKTSDEINIDLKCVKDGESDVVNSFRMLDID